MAVILHAAMENEICKKVLSARNYTTSCTQQHPQGITFSSKFLNRIDRKFGKGKLLERNRICKSVTILCGKYV